MVPERKTKLRKSLSLIVCVSMVLVVLSQAGKAAEKGRIGCIDTGRGTLVGIDPLSSLVNVNNPFSLSEYAQFSPASEQSEEKDDKTTKDKEKDERFNERGNSTSKKPPIGGD